MKDSQFISMKTMENVFGIWNIEHMGEKKMHTKFWLGNLKGRGYLDGVSVDRKITLEWILEKYGGKVWTGYIWPRNGTGGRFSWRRQ
jgi:hypothetical protein